MTDTIPNTIAREAIPNKARNRDAVPWRFIIGRELDQEEAQAVGAAFLSDAKHHTLIQAYGGFGTTTFEGDFWAPKGRGKDLSQVAKRWEKVQELFPELIVDAAIGYRVPEDLLDPFVTPVNPDLGLPPE